MTQRFNREADHFHFLKMLIGTIFLFAMLVLPNMTVCAEGDTVTLSGSGTLTSQFVNENIGDANEVIISGFSVIESYAFYGCSSLKSVSISNSVTTIRHRAFLGCSSLTSVTIPNSVSEIGSFAFSGCSSLTSVTIPDGVTTIYGYTFSGCSSLTSVTIPNSVKTIENWVFSGCSSLTSVTIPNSVTSIYGSTFSGCSSLTSVTIPNSVTSIGRDTFDRCSHLKTAGPIGGGYNIEFGWEESLPNDAFDGCDSLTSVTIPNSVTKIGEGAFRGCDSLTSVTIPNSVTSIGDYAFLLCENLMNVAIPNSVTSIGDSAFYGCSSLTSVTIPSSVTKMGDHAFSGCSSLTSVTIPNSVTKMGDYAFAGCSSLTSVTIPNAVKFIGDDVFAGCSNVTILGYSGTVAEAYANKNGIPFVCMEKENDSAEEKIENAFAEVDGAFYWFEGGVRQGTYDDPKGVVGDGTVRGREIYDPVSDGWYWLDSCFDGAKACNKEVWMPYIYQNEASWDDAEIEMNANNSGSMKQQVIDFIKNREGKWVRYDANGKMVKGWYTVEGADAELYPKQVGNTYYYDYQTGLMAKGKQVIDGQEYFFDEVTGALQK